MDFLAAQCNPTVECFSCFLTCFARSYEIYVLFVEILCSGARLGVRPRPQGNCIVAVYFLCTSIFTVDFSKILNTLQTDRTFFGNGVLEIFFHLCDFCLSFLYMTVIVKTSELFLARLYESTGRAIAVTPASVFASALLKC